MTVVVGYLRSPEGRAALQRGIEEAKLRGARLVVVNVSGEHAHVGGDFDPNLELADSELNGLREQLEREGVDHEVRRLVRGREAADELVDVAEETDADLIVIGLRRRSAVGKFLLGSNAQRILLDANCPVLAVKAAARQS
ncbi:Nucleotide-binding universal stress protein, UspA family [Micromonospora rhizosphaerae]|uniref:Nucleotide-binding universal stress protein, UspA family n=1 Tax=Micromonospora rhizosphaerae TaxID=568872 RepID=A0A1C6SAI1_9ACTN|nr:universal stress protein [Micromonospora rhizosphaerae]SCL26507.1 Nucleotide-binding universal stress protein, UspA family [Micromonospora rhizosphaerae]